MSTTATTRSTTARGVLATWQALLLAALSLLATLVAVGPAAANPHGPSDFKQPEEQPRIEVEPQCDPHGFHYDMIHPDAPANAMYLAQWREAPDGEHHNLPAGQKSGFVQSGTGDFQVRGAILVQGVPYHQYDWVDVTVFCPDEIIPVPGGDPSVTIDLEPRCDLDPAGVSYEIHVTSPPNGPTAYVAQWREGNSPVSSNPGPQGFLETGEGEFEVRGVLHHQGPGFYASDWTAVTVDCTEVKPSGEVEPDDDDPRPGNPNFTG